MSASIEHRNAMFSLIKQWQQSEISQKDFCDQHGVKTHSFHYWYKLYREVYNTVESRPTKKFIEIQAEAPSPTGAAIELLMANGNRIMFHEPVLASFLKALIS